MDACRIRRSALVLVFETSSHYKLESLMLVLRRASAVVFLMLLPMFLSCSGKKVDENDPASIMADAEDDIKGDRYAPALEKLRMVKNRFPYSKLAVEASLRIADVYFLQESFSEAAAAYELFRDLHPKHEKVTYAMLRVGKSYLSDMPSNTARDLSMGYRAVEAYEAFLRRFPEVPEAKDAKEELHKAKAQLADKELYVGEFYVREKFYYSARPRFKKVIELYPDSEAATKAKARLQEIGAEAPAGEEPNPDGKKPDATRS